MESHDHFTSGRNVASCLAGEGDPFFSVSSVKNITDIRNSNTELKFRLIAKILLPPSLPDNSQRELFTFFHGNCCQWLFYTVKVLEISLLFSKH